MARYRTYGVGRVNPLVALLVFFGIMMMLYWVAKGIFTILSATFPFVLIATAFVNHRVVLDYLSWIRGLLKSNTVLGILAVIFTIIAHPLVAGYLLYKAIRTRKSKGANKPRVSGEYIEYEEVADDFLDLSDVKNKEREIRNKYEDLL